MNQSTLTEEIALKQNGSEPQPNGRRPPYPPDSPMLWVEPWDDPSLQTYGHHPRSPYVELFWLGVLGPSSTWLLRRLSLLIEKFPTGFELDASECAREIGLSGRSALKTAFGKALDRCCRFGLMQMGENSTLFVRSRLPSVSPRMIERMPAALRQAHQKCIKSIGANWAKSEIERAKKIASVLYECGDSPDAVESHLHALQIHPALAFEASRWLVRV